MAVSHLGLTDPDDEDMAVLETAGTIMSAAQCDIS
jgi:hypothetical protein